jgi:hypothetical protein
MKERCDAMTTGAAKDVAPFDPALDKLMQAALGGGRRRRRPAAQEKLVFGAQHRVQARHIVARSRPDALYQMVYIERRACALSATRIRALTLTVRVL